MDAAISSRRYRPGLPRLIDHCEVIERVTGDVPATARDRLDTLLGTELASRLVGALAGRPRVPFAF